MKKLLLMLLICSFAANSFAAIKRIGYWGIPVAGVDYSTPALAVAACVNGDTIYVYGSVGVIDLTKRLVIIGTGYYYALNTPSNTNFNANLQNYHAYSGAQVSLSNGSSGSIITGIVGAVFVNQSHTTAINNIRISNCLFINAPTTYKNGMTYDGWEISKCYFVNTNFGYPEYSTARVTNFVFFNNIFQSASLIFPSQPGQSGIIENCSFYSQNVTPYWSNSNLVVQNCIFTNGSTPSEYNNSVFNNCVFDNTPNPGITGANNIFNASNANIYNGLPTQGAYSNDARFTLKAGSPAIGAGIGGIDCGSFGGVNPYKLSGVPAVPAFYKLTAPGTSATTNPYTITFSVKGNN